MKIVADMARLQSNCVDTYYKEELLCRIFLKNT